MAQKSGFKINKAGMRKLEQDLKKQLSGEIQVPEGGSEEDAVRHVKDHLKKLGATPNDAKVRRMVRDQRSS